MAEETKKSTTTTKKRTTTSKPKVEEPKQLSMEEQMAQMMAMMAQQQQIIMTMLQGQVPIQQSQVVEVEEEKKEESQQEEENIKEKKPEKSKTKQELRRKYKKQEIYVMNVTQGAVIYQGRNMRYTWDSYGDIEPMSIDDIVNMPKSFLSTPSLMIDKHENGADVKQEIENVLRIVDVDGYMALISQIETEGFKESTVEVMAEVVKQSRERGCDLTLDLAILVQHKIDRKELADYHIIGQLQKLLGRKFL